MLLGGDYFDASLQKKTQEKISCITEVVSTFMLFHLALLSTFGIN